MNIWKIFTHLPKLLTDLGMLQANVAEAQADPDLKAELDKSPLLKARLELISQEWRDVENDYQGIK